MISLIKPTTTFNNFQKRMCFTETGSDKIKNRIVKDTYARIFGNTQKVCRY